MRHYANKLNILWVLIVVLLSTPAVATTISYVGGTTAGSGCTTGGVNGSGSCPASYTPTTNNGVVIFSRPSTSPETPYVQDNNLNTLLQGNAAVDSSGYSLSSFAGFAKSGATTYTVYGMASSNSVVVGEYSGVLSFDMSPTYTACSGSLSANQCTGTNTDPSVTVTLDELNDVAACAFTQAPPNTSGTFEAPYTGTQRASSTATSSPTMVWVDNTSSTSTSVVVAATLAASSAWRVECVVLRVVANPQTFNILQITPPGYGSLTGPTKCTVTALSCDWPLATTTPGTLLMFAFSDHSDFNNIQRTVVTLYTCVGNSTTPCGPGNYIDIAVLPGGQCSAYASDTQPESNSEDTGYVLSGAGGANWATGVRSGANTSSERQSYALFEIQPPIGYSFLFDGCGTASITTGSSSYNITAVSPISGTNDVIVQGMTGGSYPLSITSPYLQGESIPNHQAFWVGLGLSSGAAPTITSSTAIDGAAGVARAFRLSLISTGPSTTSGTQTKGGTLQ